MYIWVTIGDREWLSYLGSVPDFPLELMIKDIFQTLACLKSLKYVYGLALISLVCMCTHKYFFMYAYIHPCEYVMKHIWIDHDYLDIIVIIALTFSSLLCMMNGT